MALTPLEKLDDAIHEFLRETNHSEDDRMITGWALAASTSRIQVEDDTALPLVTGSTYTIGPQTSIIQFAGLAQYLEVVAEKAMWQQLSDADEDD
jgi:hypothetical protein